MQNNEYVTEVKEQATWDGLAMDIAGSIRRESQAKDLGIIGLTVVAVGIAIGLSLINYKNDCDWRELFSSYDYVSQDGGGYNNVNTGTQGDLNNGAASESKEE